MKSFFSGVGRLGFDIGGTFVDFTLIDNQGNIYTKKVLSTPDDYSRGVSIGIHELLNETKIKPDTIKQVVHGTTIVTNACIELTGAKVGLITTKGFRDVLEIGRGRMPRLYDLTWRKPTPLVPRYLRMEVDERVDKNGQIVHALKEEEVSKCAEKFLAEGVESIAVALYNSPRNPIHEERIGEILRKRLPDKYLSLSTKIMPMMKEYERTCETVVNAYVMPLVANYLNRLKQRLLEQGITAPLFVMQSSGGMISAEASAERPIEIIECGPAAGVVGAGYIARELGFNDLITFDLGGTTCKASIIEQGQYTRSAEYEVGAGIHMASRLRKGKGYVLRVPSIDIAEIGAGGGSILSLDSGGMLNVGPRSAGASPGPACYNKGGTKPTLTDCYVVLGYLNPNYLCGGDFQLLPEKAKEVIATVAEPMKMDLIETAYAAYRIANSNMARAIHAVSSERGRDPRNFVLLVFGGAGALHGVEVARDLGIKRVLIAPHGGVFSSLGFLYADIERFYIRAFSSGWNKSIIDQLNMTLEQMAAEAWESSREWVYSDADLKIEKFVDLRYIQQGSELSIPVPDGVINENSLSVMRDLFDKEHEKTFGHCFSDIELEVVNLRIIARVVTSKPSLSEAKTRKRTLEGGTRRCYFGKKYGFVETRAVSPESLGVNPIAGPLLLDAYDTTIVVPPQCDIAAAKGGGMIINIH